MAEILAKQKNCLVQQRQDVASVNSKINCEFFEKNSVSKNYREVIFTTHFGSIDSKGYLDIFTTPKYIVRLLFFVLIKYIEKER